MSWWAFWRRRRRPAPASADPVPVPAGERESPEEPAPRAPAFSGARPQFAPVLEPGEFEDLWPLEALSEGMPHLQAAVVDVVRAVLARDVADVTRLLDRLDAHEADAELAPLVALTALGPRLLEAADVAPDEAAAGGVAAAAVLTQGETLVGRAEGLRRAVAPGVPGELLRFAVRYALGADVTGDPGIEAEDRDLLLAAAVLLAQGIEDGQGGPAVLAAELAELLPDA